MKNPITPILDAVRPDTVRRPTGTLRARPSSYIDAYYSAVPGEDNEHHPRPSHVRENSRSALLARSHRASHALTTYRDSRVGREYELHNESDEEDTSYRNEMVDLEMDAKGAGAGQSGPALHPAVAMKPAAGGEDLSPTQRKMALVSAALEETGMGKYQWCMCVII